MAAHPALSEEEAITKITKDTIEDIINDENNVFYSRNRYTILHWAVKYAQPNIVDKILKANPNPNLVSKLKRTPLEFCKVLLKSCNNIDKLLGNTTTSDKSSIKN